MKKQKFNGLNFDSLEKLSRDEQRKVVGGYGHNCPGYTYSGCMSQLNSGGVCVTRVGSTGPFYSGAECCAILCS